MRPGAVLCVLTPHLSCVADTAFLGGQLGYFQPSSPGDTLSWDWQIRAAGFQHMPLLGRAGITSKPLSDPLILRPMWSWKTVNSTKRQCQGPSLGLFVQKTDQQHSWKASRYSFWALSELPALTITLLLYSPLASAEVVSTLERGAGAAKSLCQKLPVLLVCNFSFSLLSLPLCNLSAPTSSIPLHKIHTGLWSWGRAGGRCSSKCQRGKHVENWEQIVKKLISIQEGFVFADSYTKSITFVIIVRALWHSLSSLVLVGFRLDL